MSGVVIDVEDSSIVRDRSMTILRPTKESSKVSHCWETKKKRRAMSLFIMSVVVRRVVIVLATLEQAAAYLAQIAFLGATVVLLGGYAPRVKLHDFKLISALLLSEGVRVFLASRNVEYSVARGLNFGNWVPGICTWPIWACAIRKTTKLKRQLFFQAILQVLQFGSAAVTFAFSLSRLKSGSYITTLSSPAEAGELANFVYGIRLFYILTLVESSIFLVVKALAWDLLLLMVRTLGNKYAHLIDFALEVYRLFMTKGFVEAAVTTFSSFLMNNISTPNYQTSLETLSWYILRRPEWFSVTDIKNLIQLTAPGVPTEVRHFANKFLASAVLKGASRQFLLAVRESGRIPLEVVDIKVIKFLDHIVTRSPLGFLPPDAISKQASAFLIKSIVEGDNKTQTQAALTFLKWWSDPTIYRRYVFDPADIFYRLFIHRQQWVRPKLDIIHLLHYSKLEEIFGYEEIADPIKAVFTQGLELPRLIIMNKLLNRVDFSKLKNKQSTVDLSGILPDVIRTVSPMLQAADSVIGLVAAWTWFMDESTFQKAICKLSEEEMGMLKNCAPIYEAILTSQKKEWFQGKELIMNVQAEIRRPSHRRASSC